MHDWLKNSLPFFIQSEQKTKDKDKTYYDSLALDFPRFRSGACDYFEFGLVQFNVYECFMSALL